MPLPSELEQALARYLSNQTKVWGKIKEKRMKDPNKIKIKSKMLNEYINGHYINDSTMKRHVVHRSTGQRYMISKEDINEASRIYLTFNLPEDVNTYLHQLIQFYVGGSD